MISCCSWGNPRCSQKLPGYRKKPEARLFWTSWGGQSSSPCHITKAEPSNLLRKLISAACLCDLILSATMPKAHNHIGEGRMTMNDETSQPFQTPERGPEILQLPDWGQPLICFTLNHWRSWTDEGSRQKKPRKIYVLMNITVTCRKRGYIQVW